MKNTIIKIKKYKGYIFCFFVIYAFMLGLFVATSVGMETYRFLLILRRYFPVALAVTISVYFWRRNGLNFKGLCPYLFVGLSWMLSHNIITFLAYREVSTNINNFFDIAFGGYIFSFLVLFQIFCLNILKRKKIILSFIVGFVQFMLIIIPLIEIAYFLNYGSGISTAAAIAVLQTNPNEAWEFIRQNLGLAGVFSFAILGVGALVLLVSQNYCIDTIPVNPKRNYYKYFSKKHLFTTVLLLLAIGIYLPKCFYGTGVMHSFAGAKQYLDSAKKFRYYHENNFYNLNVEPSKPGFSKPSTIILIIGESAGRNFMSVYGYSENNTTPWLKSMSFEDSRHFFKFNHAYSSYGSTVQALERALTEKNQYNDMDFSQSITLIDLAKKAGYKTYWFSNQSVKNTADTPIQLVAQTADVSSWIDEEPQNQGRILYDGDLLPCLQKVNPNENNFIVLHVMGSHELTLHRFPPEFTRFGKTGIFDLVTNYEDSMAYDDWVLQHIFTYAQEHLNLQAMIFFSDHGANPYRKRVADNVPFINLRIPLIVYLSDEYESLYPDTVRVLRSHENEYFTNDLMYDFVGGILQITSNHLDKKNDFSNIQYQYTRNTLKTDLGRKNISDDISEDRIE